MQTTKLIIVTPLAIAVLAGVTYVMLNQQTDTQLLNEAGYRDISSEELNSMMANKDFILVNTHIPYEGEIDGTDIFIPYNEISENLQTSSR